MKITVLNENTVYRQGLLAEHGLSLLIEEHGKKFLMDTGQTDVFIKNAKTLGVDLTDLQGIILSHGHYDHCGGMDYFAEAFPLPAIYIRERAFEQKYHGKNTKSRYIGISQRAASWSGQVHYTGEKEEIAPGFWLVSNIPLSEKFESFPEDFWIRKEEAGQETWVPDGMEDEQMLVVQTEKGLSLFLGCSHRGIINCITRVREAFPGEPIYSLMAGMHLGSASTERILQTIEALKGFHIQKLIPVHCTGKKAIGMIAAAFPETCILTDTGKVLEL